MQIPPLIRKLVDNVLGGEARTPTDIRKAAFDGDSASLPRPIGDYVTKTAKHAYKIVDRDLHALRAAGYDDGQIFEITICAAVGAGFSRLERGLKALEEAEA